MEYPMVTMVSDILWVYCQYQNSNLLTWNTQTHHMTQTLSVESVAKTYYPIKLLQGLLPRLMPALLVCHNIGSQQMLPSAQGGTVWRIGVQNCKCCSTGWMPNISRERQPVAWQSISLSHKSVIVHIGSNITNHQHPQIESKGQWEGQTWCCEIGKKSKYISFSIKSFPCPYSWSHHPFLICPHNIFSTVSELPNIQHKSNIYILKGLNMSQVEKFDSLWNNGTPSLRILIGASWMPPSSFSSTACTHQSQKQAADIAVAYSLSVFLPSFSSMKPSVDVFYETSGYRLTC